MPWKNKNNILIDSPVLPFETFKNAYRNMGLEDWQYIKLYNKASDEQLNEMSLCIGSDFKEGNDPFQYWGHPVSRNDKIDKYNNIIYSHNKSAIPSWIQNCGDIKVINSYFDENYDDLNLADTAFLMKRVDALEKAADRKRLDVRTERPKMTSNNKNHAKLDIHQTRKQSSFNGCWSCSMQLMLKSRGINNVEQEDIRAYRPPLSDKQTIEKIYSQDDIDHYGVDQGNEMFSMSDALIEFAPNTMVHETEIETYNNDASSLGISRQDYNTKLKEAVKNNILHAIKVDRSPVGIWKNGHYITVTEIDGEVLKYKDSVSNTPDTDKTMTVSELIRDMEDNEIKKPVKLVWVSDIKLSKDNKTIYDVPSTYVSMNEDGTVKLPPEKIQTNGESYMHGRNQAGNTVARIGGIEDSIDERGFRSKIDADGLLRTEKVYLPKKLNKDKLMNEAKRRSDREELRLARNSSSFYRTDMPGFLKSMDDFGTGNTSLRLDEVRTKKKKTAREEDLASTKKISAKGLENFENKDIDKNEKRLYAEEAKIRKESAAKKAAPKTASFLNELRTSPMFILDYEDIGKKEAIINTNIKIPKGRKNECINTLVLLYALGQKELSLDTVINMTGQERIKLGEDFIEEMKKHPFKSRSIASLKENIKYYGKLTKKACEQLRAEGLKFPTDADIENEESTRKFMQSKFGIASFIAETYTTISRNWRNNEKRKTKEGMESIVIGENYALGFGGEEQFKKDRNYLRSIAGIGKNMNKINDPKVKSDLKNVFLVDIAGQDSTIVDSPELINKGSSMLKKKAKEEIKTEEEQKKTDETQKKTDETQKKTDETQKKTDETQKKNDEKSEKANDDKKNVNENQKKVNEEQNTINIKSKQDEEKRIIENEKRKQDNQKKLDDEVKNIFGLSREQINEIERTAKKTQAEKDRLARLEAEKKEKERLDRINEEKIRKMRELEGKDPRSKLKVHLEDLYLFIDGIDQKISELEKSEIKANEHFGEKYNELQVKRIHGNELATKLRDILRDTIPADVYLEIIDKSMTGDEKKKIKTEHDNRIRMQKQQNKEGVDVKQEGIDAQTYINASQVIMLVSFDSFDRFINAIPKEYLEKIDDKVLKIGTYTELSDEESVYHTHSDKIKNLKDISLELADGDKNEKERLDDILTRADNCLTTIKPEVYKTYYLYGQEAYQNTYNKVYIRTEKKNAASYQNGAFTGYSFVPKGDKALTEEMQQLGDKIEKLTPPSLTPKFESGLLAMLKKMDETYSFTDEEIDEYLYEEGTKLYANRKVINSKNELKLAVEKGDIKEIEEKLLIHERDLSNMRELHRMAKEVFADSEPFNAPGNVDTIRNADAPFEFAKDFVTDSRLSGVFMLWMSAKKCGVSYEEFLKNPGVYVRKASEKKHEEIMVEKKFCEDPIELILRPGKYEQYYALMGAFGTPCALSRGLDIIKTCDPNESVRADFAQYQKLSHDHSSFAFEKEKFKVLKLQGIFDNPLENRNKFKSLAGGYLLGAGEEYDWNYGAERIDIYGKPRKDTPKSFLECYKDSNQNLKELCNRINNYIFGFQQKLGNTKNERLKNVNDFFIHGLFENAESLVRELNGDELGFNDLQRTMKYMSNYVSNKEIKDEMNAKLGELGDVFAQKNRNLTSSAEDFRSKTNKAVELLDRKSDIVKVFGPVCDQPASNNLKAEMDAVVLPVPEGYDDDMVAFVTLGASMNEELLKNKGGDVAVLRVFLIENAVNNDERMFSLYEPMNTARKNTFTALTNLNSENEELKRQAKEFVQKSCKDVINAIANTVNNNSVSVFDAIHEGKYQIFKMADKAIQAGVIEVDEVTRLKIHSYAEQIRATERVEKNCRELDNMPTAIKRDARNDKIADLVFDMYLKNTNKKVVNDNTKKVDEISAKAYADVGVDPYDPKRLDLQIEYSNFLGDMRNKLGKVSVDPVSVILNEENGVEKLKDLYMDKIKKTPEYINLVGIYDKDEFAVQLSKVQNYMVHGNEAKSLFDITENELDDVKLPFSENDVETAHKEIEKLSHEKAIKTTLEKWDSREKQIGIINDAPGKQTEYFDKLKNSYGSKANMGDLSPVKQEYDNIEFEIPEGFDEDLVVAISLGYNLDPDRLRRPMTDSSTGAKGNDALVALNLTYLTQNVPDNDDRTKRLGNYLLENRKDIKKGLDDYSRTGDKTFCGNALDKLINYAANTVTTRNKEYIVNSESALGNRDLNIIKLAAKFIDSPPLYRDGNLNEIQKRNLKAYAAEIKMNEDIANISKDMYNNPKPVGTPEREAQVSELLFKVYLRSVYEHLNDKIQVKVEESMDPVFESYGIKVMKTSDPGYTASTYSEVKEDRELINYKTAPMRNNENNNKINPLVTMLSEDNYYEQFKSLYMDKIKNTQYFKNLMYAEDDSLLYTIINVTEDKKLNIGDFNVGLPQDIIDKTNELNEKYREEYEKNYIKENIKLKREFGKAICRYEELDDKYTVDMETLKGDNIKKNNEILKSISADLLSVNSRDQEFLKIRASFKQLLEAGEALEKYKDEKEVKNYVEQGEKFSRLAIKYCIDNQDDPRKRQIVEKTLKSARAVNLSCANIEFAHMSDLEKTVPENTVDGIDKDVLMRDMFGGRFGYNGFNFMLQQSVNAIGQIIQIINPELLKNMLSVYGSYLDTRDTLDENDVRYIEPDRKTRNDSLGFQPKSSGGDRQLMEKTLDCMLKCKKEIDDYIENLSGPGLKFKGMLKAVMQCMEFRKGSYVEAFLDNEYIMGLSCLSGGMPKLQTKTDPNGKKVIDFETMENDFAFYTDAKTNKKHKGPLDELVNLYDDYNEIFEREYEKQRLVKEGMTPEKEKKYLSDLKKTLEKTVKDYELLVKFEEYNFGPYENDPPYKSLLNNNLDSITELKSRESRGISNEIGQIKGQLQAIEMGWGYDELGVLGYVCELQASLNKHITHLGMKKEEYEKINEKEHAETTQNELEEFKLFKEKCDKFAEECLHVRVETAADKKAVFDKIRDFRESGKNLDGKVGLIVNNINKQSNSAFVKTEKRLARKVELENAWANIQNPENRIFEIASEYIDAYKNNKPELKSKAREMTENIDYIREKLSKDAALSDKFNKLNESKPAASRVDISKLADVKSICGIYVKAEEAYEKIARLDAFATEKQARLQKNNIMRRSYDESRNFASKDALNMKILESMNSLFTAYSAMLPAESQVIGNNGENPILRYLTTANGRERLNGFATKFAGKHKLDESQINTEALNKEQKDELESFAFNASKEGLLMMAADHGLGFNEKARLAAGFIAANYREHELENGRSIKMDDPVKQLRMEEGIRELAVIITKGNHEQPDFSKVLELNKGMMYELTRQMEYKINSELNREVRDEYMFSVGTNRVPNLDSGVSALKKNSYIITGTEEFADIRTDLKKLNADIKKADVAYAETGIYNGANFAEREKQLLDRMDAYIVRKESEVEPSVNSVNRKNAMIAARNNLLERQKIDLKSRNVSATELSESVVYNEYMENAKMEFGVRPDRKPDQVISDYSKYEEKYRKLHASVIEKLNRQRNAGNRESIDRKIAREKELIYNSAFRSVFLEGVNDRVKDGAYNGMNEHEFVKKVKTGFASNLDSIPRMLESESGRKIRNKIDTDIKKGRLDHDTMVGRIDAELGKKNNRDNTLKTITPKKKVIVGLT